MGQTRNSNFGSSLDHVEITRNPRDMGVSSASHSIAGKEKWYRAAGKESKLKATEDDNEHTEREGPVQKEKDIV